MNQMIKRLAWAYLILLNMNLCGQGDSSFVNPMYHCGFSIGCNKNLLLTKSATTEPLNVFHGYGFRLGIFSEHELTRNIWISPRLETSFNNSDIKSSNGEMSYEVMRLHTDLMVHLSVKKQTNKLTQVMYVGPAFRYPLISNIERRFTPGNYSDLAIDLGYSLETKTNYCIFDPEIRYSVGLLNINKNPALKHVYMHTLSLLLNIKA